MEPAESTNKYTAHKTVPNPNILAQTRETNPGNSYASVKNALKHTFSLTSWPGTPLRAGHRAWTSS